MTGKRKGDRAKAVFQWNQLVQQAKGLGFEHQQQKTKHPEGQEKQFHFTYIIQSLRVAQLRGLTDLLSPQIPPERREGGVCLSSPDLQDTAQGTHFGFTPHKWLQRLSKAHTPQGWIGTRKKSRDRQCQSHCRCYCGSLRCTLRRMWRMSYH